MEVNDELIDKLAKLSHLHFAKEEKEEIKKDLKRIIEFVDKLNEIDTTGVEPLLHMSDTFNNYREDVISGSVTREEALKNAPLSDGIFFKVPKVIKN